jgi:hypothetical protein
MTDQDRLPPSHRRRFNIVGIDINGDVWSFGTSHPFRADSVLQQMKTSYRGVIFLEDGCSHQGGA